LHPEVRDSNADMTINFDILTRGSEIHELLGS